jgi:serine/threonine protein kinase
LNFKSDVKLLFKENTIYCSTLFISPEAWSPIDNYDALSPNIYSVEVLFYFMSQRKYTFPASNDDLKILVLDRNVFLKTVDSDFKSIICKMMNLNPKENPTADQLLLNTLLRRILNIVVITLLMQSKINSCFWITEIELFVILFSKQKSSLLNHLICPLFSL